MASLTAKPGRVVSIISRGLSTHHMQTHHPVHCQCVSPYGSFFQAEKFVLLFILGKEYFFFFHTHGKNSTKVEWMDGWMNKWNQDIQRIVNVQGKSHKWLLAAQAQMKTCQVNHLQKVFFYYPDRKLLGAKYIDFKAANKERKNRPQINKNCPSSLFRFISQAAAAPNHPTQFHPLV